MDMIRAVYISSAAPGLTGAELDRIGRDPRHSGMIQLMREPMEEREFEDWSMGAIHSGELADSERDALARGVDSVAGSHGGSRARSLLRSFARKAR